MIQRCLCGIGLSAICQFLCKAFFVAGHATTGEWDDPCETNCLLPILLSGSLGWSSKSISDEELKSGSETFEMIYMEVIDLITHNPRGQPGPSILDPVCLRF